MSKKIIFLTNTDYHNFQDWIKLNLEGLTWQGRYEKEFYDFWKLFFLEGLSLSQLIDRFEYAYKTIKVGPLSSWFVWLEEKLICYTFIFKELTVQEISQQTNISMNKVASILRNYFLEVFPHLEDYFSNIFQIGNVASENKNVSFAKISSDLSISSDLPGCGEDEIMASMEVTLYSEWRVFLDKMKKDVYNERINFTKLKRKASLKNQFKILRDISVLIIIGLSSVYLIKIGNKAYEKYLTDKISVYEPQFKWLNKTLSFKSSENTAKENFNVNFEEIETAEEDRVKEKEIEFDEEERFSVESEAVPTSWDSLPKDFDIADLEQSDYEEVLKRGYRESRYGQTVVFRVLMKSVDLMGTRSSLNKLLEEYKVTQVDNVKPGQDVPGGAYYNLFVPRIYLKEFIAQVMEVSDSVLYESRTRTRRNPPGKNKVFIWIKSL